MSATELDRELRAIGIKLERGLYEEAIHDLKALRRNGRNDPWLHRLLGLACTYNGQHKEAARHIKAARKSGTPDAGDEILFGRMLNTGGFHQAALDSFRLAHELERDNVMAIALISFTFEKLGETEHATKYGQWALDLRHAEALGQALDLVSPERPVPFNYEDRSRNVISYSLFGTSQYYIEAAIGIATMARGMFPEWTCRFYCDPRISKDVLKLLSLAGAQTLVAPAPPRGWEGLAWRFWAFDDPNLDVVMIRDVDSPFTVRERLAVDEWLASGLPFHAIRDHIDHREPIMAGLWGGWTGLLPPLKPMTESFVPKTADRFSDQEFLRLNVWPRIHEATLVHDRHYHLGRSRPPPDHPSGRHNHIGFGWPRQPRRQRHDVDIALPS